MSEPDSQSVLIGLDVGGTNLKGLVVSEDGEILREETTPTKDDGSKGWLDRARGVVRNLMDHCGTEAGLGVAAPGLAAPVLAGAVGRAGARPVTAPSNLAVCSFVP